MLPNKDCLFLIEEVGVALEACASLADASVFARPVRTIDLASLSPDVRNLVKFSSLFALDLIAAKRASSLEGMTRAF